MKRRMEFVLNELSRGKRTVLRFYPRSSHIYWRGDTAPTCIEDAECYECSYAIVRKDVFGKDRVLLRCEYDELSVLYDVPQAIRCVENEQCKLLKNPVGCCMWRVERCSDEDMYFFEIWNELAQGFRFEVDKDRAMRLAEFIDGLQEYMLERSEAAPE